MNVSGETERFISDDDEPGLLVNFGEMSKGSVSGGGVIEGLQDLRVQASNGALRRSRLGLQGFSQG